MQISISFLLVALAALAPAVLLVALGHGVAGGLSLLLASGLLVAAHRAKRSVQLAAESIRSAANGERADSMAAANLPGVRELVESINELHLRLEQRTAESSHHQRELFCQQCELTRMNEQIRAADRLKSEFVANVSHEVRTPLHSVLALSDVLLRETSGPMTAEQKKQVGIIERNAQSLLRMLSDILDFSKIEAGRMPVSTGPVSPGAALADVREALLPYARQQDTHVALETEPDLGAIETDGEKLNRLLMNLAHNAVKFTGQGDVTLGARARGAEGIEFFVRDTGPGIATRELEHVFEAFRQSTDAAERASSGTGLGLTIAKNLAQLLGGRIAVESVEGEGSTFRVFLPAKHAAEKVEASTGHRRVLVISASPDSGEAVRGELSANGFDCTRAFCGRDVQSALEQETASELLMDVGFMAAEGLDLFARLDDAALLGLPPLYGVWLHPTDDHGGYLGRLEVRKNGQHAELRGHATAPLALPSIITDDARRAGVAWVEAASQSSTGTRKQVVAALAADLDRDRSAGAGSATVSAASEGDTA